MSHSPLLSVRDLSKHFTIRSPFRGTTIGTVQAVNRVSFDIGEGETLGLVGESGCGKSTTGRLLLRLIEPDKGQVLYEDRNLLQLDAVELKKIRKSIQIVFQDPFSSLNPRMTVEEIVNEPLYVQGGLSRKEMRERAQALLDKVGLNSAHITRFPHEFSGGQRQRIGIARALAGEPRFIVCDEAVSALDVSVQAQVINLLKDLQEEFNLSYLFIAHDLSVVRHISDRVAVMYLGEVVEIARKDALYTAPRHPYTQALLAAIPVAHPRLRGKRARLGGEVSSALNPPPGCRFSQRCPIARDICRQEAPELRDMGERHQVACHFAEDTRAAAA
ncbi:MAG: dipeptide ABC transporter ATP-binding protein [Rhizobiaceae bacterium]|nr:dipeptide ABC transporter ATP-binding protein [Rhizobiaceae bacterium]